MSHDNPICIFVYSKLSDISLGMDIQNFYIQFIYQ